MTDEVHCCVNQWTKFASREVEGDGARDPWRSVAEPGKFLAPPVELM
jgi:hypothetical protein